MFSLCARVNNAFTVELMSTAQPDVSTGTVDRR